jgi:hypothetical protein
MSVKGVKGGRAGGAARASAAAGAAKTSAAGFAGRVESTGGVSGAAGAGPSAGVVQAAPPDAVTAQVLDLARQLKEGQLKSREEATKKLVADILRDKVASKSKKLSQQVFEQLNDDPRLKQTLERMWSRAEAEHDG